MNWEAIAAVSETISSIAVIVSLIYLAQQIKHSNKLSQGQTRTDLRHMAQAEVYKVVDYPEIQSSQFKEELTENERIRLHSFLINALRFREFIWRQYQQHLLDAATFENYSRALLQVLGSARCRRWWDQFKVTGFDPMFVRFVDDLLASHPELDVRDLYNTLQG